MSQNPKWKEAVQRELPLHIDLNVLYCANKHEALEQLRRARRGVGKNYKTIPMLADGLPFRPPTKTPPLHSSPPPSQHGKKGDRVRLTVDLREYDARCAVGSEGIPGPPCDMWARTFPARFVGVYFDSGARLDVLWTGLEPVTP